MVERFGAIPEMQMFLALFSAIRPNIQYGTDSMTELYKKIFYMFWKYSSNDMIISPDF